MNKTLSFVRLDFITVKPYLTAKTLLMLAAMLLIMSFTTAGSNWLIGFYMFFFSIMYVSYPFAVGEQNGIDMLYSTLSISRETVVRGRYIFSMCVTAGAGIIMYILSFISAFIFKKPFSYTEGLAVFAVIFVLCGILQSVQLPIYFKLGYAKAKIAVYLPMIIISAGIAAFSMAFKDSIPEKLIDILSKIGDKPVVIGFIGVGFWLVLLGLSYGLSLSFYKKRDF